VNGAGRHVVILTTCDVALAVCASGFLLKDARGDQLEPSSRLVATCKALLALTITRHLIERYAKPVPLTRVRQLNSGAARTSSPSCGVGAVSKPDRTGMRGRSSTSTLVPVGPRCEMTETG
jgi:hypothetical protein